MKEYLFAYGTLKQGFAPSEIAKTVEKMIFIGEGFVYGKVQDFGKYPVFQLGGSEKVLGHIYELPDEEEVLQIFDEYEGFFPDNHSQSLFLRKKTVAYLNESEINCWIYEFNWSK